MKYLDSPHPRGWTPGSIGDQPGSPGFPAPAGMDPATSAGAGGPRRIPRTRGDGPRGGGLVDAHRGDSPHPRGWTVSYLRALRKRAGFPAPAGMDPGEERGERGRLWIPRTRGDGPGSPRALLRPMRDSPHPRGWTQQPALPDPPRRGFPAPAGMDRPEVPGPARGDRIPRTRGDGPELQSVDGPADADSPHPRGWTPHEGHVRPGRDGFPAPAGMDPAAYNPRRGRLGIPRTRGDGPASMSMVRMGGPDSPHPRGWTRAVVGQARGRRGFPAPAGMDPARRLSSTMADGIPRTRGDGPRSLCAIGSLLPDSPHPRGWTHGYRVGDLDLEGFPAPAGMDRYADFTLTLLTRIPRTRGDGPPRRRSRRAAPGDSPHPRGWTRGPEALHLVDGGFPAPAGMDRRHGADDGVLRWIPRTRGDGPRREQADRRPQVDSPHPRGWTRNSPETPGSGDGFPAPAGMDPGSTCPASSSARIPRTRGDGPHMVDGHE